MDSNKLLETSCSTLEDFIDEEIDGYYYQGCSEKIYVKYWNNDKSNFKIFKNIDEAKEFLKTRIGEVKFISKD